MVAFVPEKGGDLLPTQPFSTEYPFWTILGTGLALQRGGWGGVGFNE